MSGRDPAPFRADGGPASSFEAPDSSVPLIWPKPGSTIPSLREFSRFMRVLAADAPRLHGLTPSLAIIDELHAHRDDEVYLAMRTAVLKRPGSKLVVISTAAQGSDTPLARLRSRALGHPSVKRRGAVIDAKRETVRLLEWSVPEDTDIDDFKAAKAANPASWISIAGLRAQREAVHEVAYRRYHRNEFTEAGNTWLSPGSWQSCAGEPRFKDGEAIFVAVDLGGGQRSTSAVVWCNRELQIGVEITADDYPVEFRSWTGWPSATGSPS